MATDKMVLGGMDCLSDFLDHGHRLALVGVASFETVSSCAVTFCGSEAGLLLESVSSTMTSVEWLTVADCRPRPLTWLV